MRDVGDTGATVTFVLDCSATLAAVLPDEVNAGALSVLERAANDHVHVPSLWWLEIANSLSVAIRRNRIDTVFLDETLEDLGTIDIRTDAATARRAWTDTLRLADTLGLTVYDAAYLELAQRLSVPLATLDARLRAAATSRNVPLLNA